MAEVEKECPMELGIISQWCGKLECTECVRDYAGALLRMKQMEHLMIKEGLSDAGLRLKILLDLRSETNDYAVVAEVKNAKILTNPDLKLSQEEILFIIDLLRMKMPSTPLVNEAISAAEGVYYTRQEYIESGKIKDHKSLKKLLGEKPIKGHKRVSLSGNSTDSFLGSDDFNAYFMDNGRYFRVPTMHLQAVKNLYIGPGVPVAEGWTIIPPQDPSTGKFINPCMQIDAEEIAKLKQDGVIPEDC